MQRLTGCYHTYVINIYFIIIDLCIQVQKSFELLENHTPTKTVNPVRRFLLSK